MPLVCPKCGSRFLRDSRPRESDEKGLKWRLKSPMRCLDCKTRFIGSMFVLADLPYARCPKCERMDLNGWTGKTYDPPFLMAVKAALGASKLRCEYCRINFVSFRRRKEVFTFKRWKNMNSAEARAAGRAARLQEHQNREESK